MIKNHYHELKNRLFLLTLTWSTTIVICYSYKEILIFIFIQPILYLEKNYTLYFIFTNLTDIFSAYFQLIEFISTQTLLFYFLYHILNFLTPGLYIFEYKVLKFILINGCIFWYFSILFLNKLILPLSWEFFLSYQQTLTNQPYNFYFEAKITEYLNYYIILFYACNLNFQIFVLLNIYIYFNKTNLKIIQSYRKYFYFFLILISTWITPPDIYSQLILSSFFIIIYEFIIISNIIKQVLIR